MPQQQLRGSHGLPRSSAQVAEAQNALLERALGTAPAGAAPERDHHPRQRGGILAITSGITATLQPLFGGGGDRAS